MIKSHESQNSPIVNLKMKGPFYIWLGMILVSAYFTWQAYAMTDSSFKPQFPVFDSSNSMMMGLGLCAVLNAFLDWVIPSYLFKLGRAQAPKMSICFLAFVVRLSLVGSINIYGLVLAVSNHDANLVLPFSILSFLGYLKSFPRPESFGY